MVRVGYAVARHIPHPLAKTNKKRHTKRMHTPIRTCAATGEKHPQSTLLRFTNVNGVPLPDATRRAPGRGVYILPTETAYTAAVKRKVFAARLKTGKPPLPWAEIAPHLPSCNPITL